MKPSSEQPLNTSADAPAARGFSLPVPGGSFATGWLAFVFAYGVALIVSESLRPPTALCSPVWLPAGLLVAVLVSASERRRPLILGTAAVLGFLYALGKRDGVTPALLETFGGILEAVAAVVLAGLWQGRRGSGSRGGAIGLLAISALPGPALGAALIASAHLLSPGSGGYLSTWLALWCRDVLSILLIVPLAMGAVSERRSWMDLTFRVRRLEAALLAVLAAASAWIVFSLIRVAGTEVKFLAVPIFVWAAMRFQARGVALAGALVSLTVFGLATWDPGAAGAFAPGLIELLQVFFVVAVATALMIAIAWTEYQSSAGRLMRLRDAMAEIVVTLEVMRDASGAVEDFLVVDANPAFRTASGRQEPAASAVRLSAFIENPGLAYGREAEALLRDRRPRRLEVRSSRSGRWYQVSAYVPEDRDRIVAVATDITPVKEREAEVLRLSRRYEIVSDVNQAIVRSASREDMLRQVCAALVREGRFEVAWSGRFRGTEDRLVRVASAGDESLLADLRALGPEAEGMLARRAFEVGGVVACSRTGDDPTVRPWGPVAARHGIVAVAAFPLREDGRVIGAVAVGTGDGQDFCREEIGLLEQVSQDVGYALDKIRSDELGAQTVANLLESDRRFRGLFEQAPIAYQALDVRGVIVDVNPAWLALFRATRPESIGRPFMDFMPDEHRPDFIRGFSALVSGGGERAFEMALAREDGDPFSAHVTVRAQGDRAGGFQVAHCVIHDISERLRYERSLREGEERIKTAFEIANDGIWEADLRTGKLTLSSRFYTMLGYEPGAFDETPREWIDRIHPDDVARIVGRYPDFLASAEDSFEIEYRLRDRGGAWRWIMARGRVVEKGPAGEKARILGTNSDITARKQSELALRQSERRLALVIEGSALAAWDWDLHSNEILFNAYWARLTGNGDAERILSAQEWRTLIHTQDLPAVRLAFEDHLAGVQPHFECEYRVRKGDGNWVWVYDRGQVIARDGSGGPLRAAGTLRDITDRRLAEKQVREQAALLDQTQDIVIATDTAGRVRFANRSAEVFFGPSEEGLHDRRLADLFEGSEPAFDGAAIERVVADREWATEVRLEKGFLKGRILDARWSVVHSDAESPERLLLVCTDITDRRLLEARFLRAQRMESIGSLASGVAHDLNNIFLPISLAAHILKKSPPEDQRASLHAMLDQSAQRGADLVQQLLTFGRGLDGRRVELQPRMLFHEVRRIIRETFPKNIVLETRIPEDLWTVSADPTQIHQVLLNLCLNARDAMAAGGTLSLAAENVVFDEHYAAMNPEAEAGPYVILEVVDTGVGIPADNLEKIFDPFFTTKEPGVGTGLGLSTVHGIVKGHGGFVQVRSQVGEGTLFKVYLPAIPAVVEVSEIPPGEEIPTGSGETILVVDDEEAVRETLRDMLENHGYRVILAPDGRQGLVCYQQQRQLVRALVTDVMMPVMDGAELVRAIRREDPDLPVIAMSGLPEKELAAGEEGARADAFIMKPFVSEQLLVELHSVLAPGAPPGKELNPSARP